MVLDNTHRQVEFSLDPSQMGAGIRFDELQYADSVGVLNPHYFGRLRLCTLRAYPLSGSEKCLGVGSKETFVAALGLVLKELGTLDHPLLELKEKREFEWNGLMYYIPPVDWNRAKVFPSGSFRTAKYPTVGISCFAVTIWAPRLWALAADSSMELTEK